MGLLQGVEAQGTQPHVTVMAAVGEEEGQHLPMNHMMPLSMFTNSSRPPLQEDRSMAGWQRCFHLEVLPFLPFLPSSVITLLTVFLISIIIFN